MPEFVYVGRLPNGHQIVGQLTAGSAKEAELLVRRRGVTPKKISWALPFGSKKPSMRDLATFTGQLASLTSAGVRIDEAIMSIAPQFRPPFANTLLEVARDFRDGLNFGDAMARHPDMFDRFLIGIIDAGAKSGKLESSLRLANAFLKRQHGVVAKIKKAVTYPLISLVVAIIVAFFLMIYIVPQFASMLQDLGGKLPIVTVILLSTSSFLQRYWLFVLLAIALLGYGFTVWKRGPGKPVWDRLLLKIPTVRNIVRLQILQLITRMWPMITYSKLSHADAIKMIANMIDNVYYRRALEEIPKNINRGAALAEAFDRYPQYFPTNLVAYIRAGADSGKLDETLAEAASFFEEDLDATVDQLQSVLEPVMMLLIGGIVVVIIMGVILPYFKIAGNIK